MKRGAGCPGLAGALPLGASAADPTRHGGLLLGSGSSGKVCWKMVGIVSVRCYRHFDATYVIYLEYVHDVDPVRKSGIEGDLSTDQNQSPLTVERT